MEVFGTEAEILIPMSSACVGGHSHSTIQHPHSTNEVEIPIPMSSACVGGHSHSTIQHPHSTNGSPPSRSADTQEDHHRNHLMTSKEGRRRQGTSITIFSFPWRSRRGLGPSSLPSRRRRCLGLLRRSGGGCRSRRRAWCSSSARRLA